jgi:hypothetical protein
MAITDQSIVKVSGAPAAGEQVVAALPDLTEFNETLEDAIAGTYVSIPATTADLFPYVDSATNAVQWSSLADLVDEAVVDASIRGNLLSLLSSSTPTAIPIFDTGFYSSTPAIVATVGDIGLTTNIPIRYNVTVTGSMKAPSNQEFTFQIYANDVACGRSVIANGISNSKFNNFTLVCTTQSLGIGDVIDVRVSDSGNTIGELDMDISIRFAGS